MENRPAPLRSRRVCRFCLSDSEPLSFIYERDHNKPFQVPLALQIMSCVAIEVSGPAANDTLNGPTDGGIDPNTTAEFLSRVILARDPGSSDRASRI